MTEMANHICKKSPRLFTISSNAADDGNQYTGVNRGIFQEYLVYFVHSQMEEMSHKHKVELSNLKMRFV